MNAEVTVQGLVLATLKDGRKAAIIRTSDRIAFKSCRRKWGFSSHMKMNLGSKQLAAPLWFGSAIHYALEDYHGWKKFDTAAHAFKAYCVATAHNFKRDLPPDAQEHYELGLAMMNYYENMWLADYPRKVDETYWLNGVPQVEVNFEVEVPIEPGSLLADHCAKAGIDVVLYRGTIDRMAIDDWGQLWIVEYKTAKVVQSSHYLTDPQVTTYVWAASLIYDLPVAGVIYQQFVKKTPNKPPILSSGVVSTAANLVSSYPLYRARLTEIYGSVSKAPSKNQTKLTELMRAENEHRDRYIIREHINRNPTQCQHEAQKILLELEDMINPDLPLYPNPTRDCSRMCSFLTPCINMDDGSDWEHALEVAYSSRDQDMDRMWRKRVPSPEELRRQQEVQEEPDLIGIQIQALQDDAGYKQAQIDAGDYEDPEWIEQKDPFAGMDEKGRFNMAEVQV